jgi:polyisoprenoid-binding protein YceI
MTSKFTDITFKSTGIEGTSDSFKLTGDLTLHGVTKKVVLDAKLAGPVNDGFGNEKVAIQAKTKLNRKDFGLTWNKAVEVGPVVGDEVSIDLKIEAAHPLAKK